MLVSLFAAVVLVALWVAAWLHWVFAGDIRQFLFAKVFPRRWRGSRTPGELLALPSSNVSSENIGSFLVLESRAPAFVNGVLGCPGCLSAHLSAIGTVAAVAVVTDWGTLEALPFAASLPLVWAAGAWIGHRLHAKV
jgi:hypothetical protein